MARELLSIGRASVSGDDALIGALDELTTYNTALTDTQVEGIYDALGAGKHLWVEPGTQDRPSSWPE